MKKALLVDGIPKFAIVIIQILSSYSLKKCSNMS